MSGNIEFGPNGQEQLHARYKAAFESSFAIFHSEQAESYSPEDGAEELTLRVVSQEGDALGRLGMGEINATYIGSTLHENGYQDPETVNVTTYTPTGEELGSYLLEHDIMSGAYKMDVEPDESSPLMDADDDPIAHPATDIEVLEYLSILNSVKENLTHATDNL